MGDVAFTQKAFVRLDSLRALLQNPKTNRSNVRVDRLADDLDAVIARFIQGPQCRNTRCDKHVQLEPIVTDYFCSPSCREMAATETAKTEARISEAMQEHKF
jgi:hypothetical protein